MAARRPGDAFAIGNDEQYRPVQAVGDQRVPVGGPEGTDGWRATPRVRCTSRGGGRW